MQEQPNHPEQPERPTPDEATAVKPKDKRTRLIVFVVALIALINIAVGAFYYVFFTANQFEGESPRRFVIHEGQPFASVVDSLHSQGIIPNRFYFTVAAKITGAARDVQAGRYAIPNGLSYFELLDFFVEGKAERQIEVALYGGISVKGAAARVAAKLDVEKETFLALANDPTFLRSIGFEGNSIEGWLLPDFYRFYPEARASDVIEEMYANFRRFYDDTLQRRTLDIGMTERQIVTLASIVQGETRDSAEMRVIAGVYHNRLEKGMKLQACPTIQYLKGGTYDRLLYRDFEIESPYNTYKYFGLPPGPINNPGKNAIMAALYPNKHNYLYFVATPEGKNDFSATLSEHNRKAKKYHRWLDALERKRRESSQ
jgi:UPF0755 protein